MVAWLPFRRASVSSAPNLGKMHFEALSSSKALQIRGQIPPDVTVS